MDPLFIAVSQVAEPMTLITILAASIFGLFVGAIPGLTATLAVALLVPLTFVMDPIPAVGAVVSCSAMAIFAGDIPGTLLRIPGTSASAAYASEGFLMTERGESHKALAANLLFSAIGGLAGTAVLIIFAPFLAEFSLQFSSFEYFWLALLGLTSAALVSSSQPVKGAFSLLIGLSLSVIGLNNPAGIPRLTFSSIDLMGGIELIPAMIGLFALTRVYRWAAGGIVAPPVPTRIAKRILSDWGALIRRYWRQQIRGNLVGVVIGILPGAGADVAAWIAYSISKRFSKTPEKFGTGHLEGIVESTSANNASLSGAWVPALVFGIPGDSITAIAVGVLYMQGLNPGPTIFIEQPQNLYSVFLIFILANILMIPLGLTLIRLSGWVLRIPYDYLMPAILAFSIVGAFAVTNSMFGVVIAVVIGFLGLFMEDNDIPLAPCVLGLILGPMIEETFVTSMIKSNGSFIDFFNRPIAGTLGVATLCIWCAPFLLAALRGRSN